MLELIELFPFRKASSCAEPFVECKSAICLCRPGQAFYLLSIEAHDCNTIFSTKIMTFFSFRLQFWRKYIIIPSDSVLYKFHYMNALITNSGDGRSEIVCT